MDFSHNAHNWTTRAMSAAPIC